MNQRSPYPDVLLDFANIYYRYYPEKDKKKPARRFMPLARAAFYGRKAKHKKGPQ